MSGTAERTFGVEEELLLVDPETRGLASVSGAAVAANEADIEVGHELFLPQIETSTRPCRTGDELDRALRAGRKAVGEAAAAAGARAVAVATAPLNQPGSAVTPEPRYLQIESGWGEIARQSVVCAMHVHVSVSDDEEAVRVTDRIRPWLPLLLAISANSPYWETRDTGYASWRSQVISRWPTAGPSEPFGDARTYRETTDRMIELGAARDRAMLYFDVRPSVQYPTVEIRVPDVCTDVDDAVAVALLIRALVETCAAPDEVVPYRADLLQVAAWRAGRFGLSADLVDPSGLRLVTPREAFGSALEFAADALERSGDRERIVAAFEALAARGTGATRQRRTFETTGELAAVVDDLARRTEESWG